MVMNACSTLVIGTVYLMSLPHWVGLLPVFLNMQTLQFFSSYTDCIYSMAMFTHTMYHTVKQELLLFLSVASPQYVLTLFAVNTVKRVAR